MKKLALVVSSIFVVIPQVSMATEGYVGGKLGYSWQKDSCFTGHCDEENFSGGIYGGVNANEYFGIELGYDWLGESTLSGDRLSAFTFAPKLSYPIGKGAIYGKIGGAVTKMDSMKDTTVFGALGLEYDLSDNFTTRLEYQHINDMFSDKFNDASVDSIFLGIAYRFGGSKVDTPEPIIVPIVAIEPKPQTEPEVKSEPEKKTKIFKEFGIEQFANSSSELSHDSVSYFNWIAETMKLYPQAQLTVVGHTDSTGSEEYNKKLSEKRARSVADYLYENGVEKSRIKIIGEGESRPKASNKTEEGRRENRRVEVIIDEFEYQVK